MYDKIISHLQIDEIGTNFPQVDLRENLIIILLIILGIVRSTLVGKRIVL